MLFDDVTVTNEEFTEPMLRDPTEVGIGLAFCWDEDHFYMKDGSPVMVTAVDAVKEWLELVVRTRQGRYPIYPIDFGGDALDLIGKKIPRGFSLSEFKRKMLESSRYNPGIDDMEDFTWDGEKISISVLLSDGTKEVAEFEQGY